MGGGEGGGEGDREKGIGENDVYLRDGICVERGC